MVIAIATVYKLSYLTQCFHCLAVLITQTILSIEATATYVNSCSCIRSVVGGTRPKSFHLLLPCSTPGKVSCAG